jgi:hypothetical protein
MAVIGTGLRGCNQIARLPQIVAPAKAGAQGKRLKSLDSRLRGNDEIKHLRAKIQFPDSGLRRLVAGEINGAEQLQRRMFRNPFANESKIA